MIFTIQLYFNFLLRATPYYYDIKTKSFYVIINIHDLTYNYINLLNFLFLMTIVSFDYSQDLNIVNLLNE